jgi:cystathionine beta-synthase (O-acetyl-L-serine)
VEVVKVRVYKNVQELIGHTPLIELTRFSLPKGVRLFAKLECFNPGGSIKDRLGKKLIEDALHKGLLKEGGTIIETTAGNTGIGLALAAIPYNIQVLFVVPDKFSIEKQLLMKALGAVVINTKAEDGLAGAMKKVEELQMEIPNSYSPKQFENESNPKAYYETLGPEVWEALEGKIDIFVAGAGTGGTFMGTAKYLKEKNPFIKTVIVEPEGSILNGGSVKPYEVEGIGMEFLSPFIDIGYFDGIYTVKDNDSFQRVEELARKEGLLVGGSSGAVLHASLLEAEKASPGTYIVTVFPDSGERYLSKNMYKG